MYLPTFQTNPTCLAFIENVQVLFLDTLNQSNCNLPTILQGIVNLKQQVTQKQ